MSYHHTPRVITFMSTNFKQTEQRGTSECVQLCFVRENERNPKATINTWLSSTIASLQRAHRRQSINQSINHILFAQLLIQHDIAIQNKQYKWTGRLLRLRSNHWFRSTQYSILQNYIIFVVVTMMWSI